jgi:uncharacterized membrane protein HdeD (DUF308 family)
MMSATMNIFALGAIGFAGLVAGLFFLRFWRETRDRLFLFFGLAFFVEAISRVGLALSAQPSEGDLVFYVLRLMSFVLIVVAIADKNWARTGRRA